MSLLYLHIINMKIIISVNIKVEIALRLIICNLMFKAIYVVGSIYNFSFARESAFVFVIWKLNKMFIAKK